MTTQIVVVALDTVRVRRVGASQSHPRRQVLVEHIRQAVAGQPAGPQEYPRDAAIQPGGSSFYSRQNFDQ
jgi:hypothetical protein